MAFRASLSVFLGCQFGQANKLLSAAERGDFTQVKQVLVSKPQLAAFTGFNGTTSPLHRAAAAGHLSTCKTILELIKSKIAETENAVKNGNQRFSRLKRCKSLLKTVIDQRSHRGQTALMLACEAGHADVTSYLLNEGADALATDMFHSRTALHYAAAGGHAQCIKVLCSDTALVEVEGTRRLLRDVITDDLQVRSAKFIDQRSSGGLTALHFAAVSGNLDSLQALLRAGAALMVKTDAEAFIGQEYLTSGSTPLHIAVIVGSIPLAHALLQAHAEMMTVVSLGRDERRRRPWEGHSRSDIRSVRNAARKLPYHLARDKQWTQMMHLIDPRISVDAALDAARDTDHGIGPKNLGTICSLVLQSSLLQWLDQTETEIEAAEKEESSLGQEKQGVVAGAAVSLSPFAGVVEAHDGAGQPLEDAQMSALVTAAPVTPRTEDTALSTNEGAASASPSTTAAPAAALVAASAPAIPTLSMQSMGSLHTYLGMLCTRRPSAFDPDSSLHKQENNEQTSPSGTRLRHHHRSATLADGDLSRLIPTTQPAPPPPAASPNFGRSGSYTLKSRALPRASSTGNLMGRTSVLLQLAFPAAPTDGTVLVHSLKNSGGRPTAGAARDGLSAMHAAGSSDDDGACIQDQGQQQQGGRTMRRVLSTLCERLKSSDGSPAPADGDTAQSLTSYATENSINNENNTEQTTTRGGGDGEGGAPAADGGGSTVHSHIGKGCYSGSASSAIYGSESLCNTGTTTTTTHCGDSSSSSCSDEYDAASGSSSGSDIECGVCLDNGVQVAFSGCEHALCIQCARNLTKQEKKPPTCPFCRRMVVGFVKVT
ncbi:hypothetical protein Ndes2526A_g00178 [Nannochloris sp. 'desiccata']|nr:hypothetical protein KSW81_002987 [Chlorella desiccata (nom. nud.)]